MDKLTMEKGSRPIQLTIAFPPFTTDESVTSDGTAKDGTGETEASAVTVTARVEDTLSTSTASLPVRSKAERKESAPSPAAASSGKKRRWYSLMDKVWALPNLEAAWNRVASNRGKPGVDGVTIKTFSTNAEQRLAELQSDLRAKTYRPQAVRRVYIEKDGKGQRPLGIPTVRDRIAQQALRQILEPIFEGKFCPRSHGFRPERGCASALKVVDRAVRHGYEWVVDADIAKFFDTVDHDKLINAVYEEVSDGSVLKLIRRILQAGFIEPETAEVEPTLDGTPQGSPLSPLLANIYLHHFDEKMMEAGFGLVRYADDFVIFTRSESEAQAALQLAQEVLEDELGLRVHPEKTRVVSVDVGFEFLGFHYYRDRKTNTMSKAVRRKSMQRFRDKVRRRTRRPKNGRKRNPRRLSYSQLAKNQLVRKQIADVNRFLRSWHWYFKTVWSPYETPFRSFDEFTRRRLRVAISGDSVAKGWWNKRIPNKLLTRLGFISLHELHRQYQRGLLQTPLRKDRSEGKLYTGKPYVQFGKAGGG